MPRSSALRLVPFVALLAVAVSGSASARPVAGDAERPRTGGTVVVGLLPEPPSLNMWVLPGSSAPATFQAVVPTMDSGLRFDRRGLLRPLLLDGQPRIVRRDPLTVQFSYKRAARWNDGTPITGHDYVYAWRNAPAMHGAEEIRRVRVSGPGAKTVTVTFRVPWATWRFSAGGVWVLPRHVLEGESLEQVWRTDINNPKTGRPISNGPFQFQSWERGKEIVLARNANYWGRKAYLDRIVYRVFSTPVELNEALRKGEVHVTFGGPLLAEFKSDRRFRVQGGPGYQWEHLEFQQGPQGHPALKQRYVREAIAAGINRRQIARSVYGSAVPDLPVLENVIYMPFEPQYHPNWAIHRFDQQRAIDLLRRNGCTGGPARPGAGGVYTCPEVGQLSFRFVTSAGNPVREQAFRIMQTQLRSIGIEARLGFVPLAQFSPGVIRGGDWDVIMFTFVSSPIAAANAKQVSACGGVSNVRAYCNRTVTRLLEQVATTIDDEQRAALANRADALMARDVSLLPLFSLPSFVVHQTRVRGVERTPVSALAPAAGNPGNWWLAP